MHWKISKSVRNGLQLIHLEDTPAILRTFQADRIDFLFSFLKFVEKPKTCNERRFYPLLLRNIAEIRPKLTRILNETRCLSNELKRPNFKETVVLRR